MSSVVLDTIKEVLIDGGWLPREGSLDSLFLPQTPPLDITGTNNYRALLTFGHPELGLIFLHDYELLAQTLDRPLEELPPISRVIGEVVGKTDRLLKTASELLSDEGELLIPFAFVLLNFPEGQQKSRTTRVYRSGLPLLGETIAQLSKSAQENPLWQELNPSERWQLLKIAGAVVSGTRSIRKRIEPPSDRPKSGTKAAIIRDLERHIAVSDTRQQLIFLGEWEGVQRIRGLAGSGKTAMLALKAFYLHYRNPDWNIAITYYSRALYAHFEKLLSAIAAHFEKEVNLEKVHILHAWGGAEKPGFYSTIAEELSVKPETYNEARELFLREAGTFDPSVSQGIFGGAIKRLLLDLKQAINQRRFEPKFDAILIDEAQDLPKEFFQLAWLVAKHPRRIAYAYDDMQTLVGSGLPEPPELFGSDVVFEQGGQNDIWLERVYRTNRFVLSTAHAIGFGIYRSGGQVQAFDPPSTWEQIGYTVEDGKLSFGEEVTLHRSNSAHDENTEQLFPEDTADDIVIFKVFKDKEAEAQWLLQAIQEDLNQGVSPKNFLIVAYDPRKARDFYNLLKSHLVDGSLRTPSGEVVDIHMVGNTTKPERVFLDYSIAFMHIYRAKGLESPIVYVVGCEEADLSATEKVSAEVVLRRNFLFTAITRAHGWVRISGVGEQAKKLREEYEALKKNGFRFRFRYPSEAEVKDMRRIRLAAQEMLSGSTAEERVPQEQIEDLYKRFEEEKAVYGEREAFNRLIQRAAKLREGTKKRR